MNRPSVFTQRVHPLVYRCLALISLALSIPAFLYAVSAYLRGGAYYLEGTISSALIGTIFLGGAFCAFIGAKRSARNRCEINQLPPGDTADAQLWSSARVRWPLAVCCSVISALFLVPAAFVYAEWRFDFDVPDFGVLEFATRPPPLEFFALSACGVAFLSIAIGLVFRQHRKAAWGLLLFLVVAIALVAYGLFFTPV